MSLYKIVRGTCHLTKRYKFYEKIRVLCRVIWQDNKKYISSYTKEQLETIKIFFQTFDWHQDDIKKRMHGSATLIFLIVAHTVPYIQYTHGERTICKESAFRPCAQNLCWCSRKTACCEGHGHRLRYIPTLPKTIQTIKFFGNFLPQVSRTSFTNISFRNLKLARLDIVNNGVLSITENAFADLPHLHRLDISNNPKINQTELSLSFKSLPKRRLRNLIMGNIGLTAMIPDFFFGGLQSSSTYSLSLESNRLTCVNMSVFQYLPNLVRLVITKKCDKRVHCGYRPSNSEKFAIDKQWDYPKSTLVLSVQR